MQALVADLAADVAYTPTPHRLRRLGLPIHLGIKRVEEIAQQLEARVQADPPRIDAPAADPDHESGGAGDGAHWICEEFAKQLPHRVEILDFYHLCEHLGKVAQAMHGAGTAAAALWLKQTKKTLLEKGPEPLLAALSTWKPRKKAAIEVKRQETGYFTANQERMDYPAYVRQGFPIGSGAVEGAGKRVVSERFKRGGMRWNMETAEPLRHLRAALLTKPSASAKYPY